MSQDLVTDERSIRILDLLEQLKRVNQMISMHLNLENGDFMAEQYERQKRQFVNELKTMLLDYDLSVEAITKAA
jgi:hypothetical protein